MACTFCMSELSACAFDALQRSRERLSLCRSCAVLGVGTMSRKGRRVLGHGVPCVSTSVHQRRSNEAATACGAPLGHAPVTVMACNWQILSGAEGPLRWPFRRAQKWLGMRSQRRVATACSRRRGHCQLQRYCNNIARILSIIIIVIDAKAI